MLIFGACLKLEQARKSVEAWELSSLGCLHLVDRLFILHDSLFFSSLLSFIRSLLPSSTGLYIRFYIRSSFVVEPYL